MAKKHYNLYKKIISPLNLWFAYKQAARGKRYKPAAAHFEYDLEKNVLALEHELTTETYQPGEYHNFYIHKPKKRLISAAPFRDRVVHYALMNIIDPFFERLFIFDSYANRKGKGTHKALDRCTYFLRRHRQQHRFSLLPITSRKIFNRNAVCSRMCCVCWGSECRCFLSVWGRANIK